MKQILITLSLLMFVLPNVYAEDSSLPWIQLTVTPSVETNTESQITLIPKDTELVDGDAFPIYQEAIQSFPKDFNSANFSQWRKLPNDLDQLPIEEIESELKKLEPTIILLSQAALCKDCNWPAIKPEQVQTLLSNDYNTFIKFMRILEFKAKIQIVQKQYDLAIETIKTNLKLANNLGRAPYLMHANIGAATGDVTLERIDQILQSNYTHNLYFALKELPQPLVDVSIAIKVEIDNLQNQSILLRSQFRQILEPAHERITKITNHVDRKIAALQIIEALRLYAGSNSGKFPEKLSDITKYKIPNDPVTGKPFIYKSTGTEATLQLEGTEGSEGRDAIRYEIILKQ